VGVLLNLASLVLYAPPLFLDPQSDNRIFDVIKMSEQPLGGDLHEPILRYRLTIPLIAHLLGFRSIGSLYALQVVFNCAFLAMLFAVIASRTPRALALMASACFAFSQAGQTGNTWLGVQDPVTNFSICLLMVRTDLWVSAVIFAGLLADERAVLALPFVLIWHALEDDPEKGPGLSRVFRPLLVFAVGAAAAFGLRRALQSGLIGPGIPKLKVYDGIAQNIRSPLRQLFSYPDSFFLAPLFAFRFLWLLPAFMLTRVPSSITKGLTWLTLLGIAGGTLVVSFGGDWTRSVAFMFPAFLWMVPVLAKHARDARKIFMVVLLGMVLSPQFFNDPTRGGWIRPLPAVLMRLIHS